VAAGGFDGPPMQYTETEREAQQVAPTFAEMVDAELQLMESNSKGFREQGGYYLTLHPGGGTTRAHPALSSGERPLDHALSGKGWWEFRPRPGAGLIGAGAVILGLSAARVATGWAPSRELLLFVAASWAGGGALVLWGWSRLRRAKAARPDLSWPQFLRGDLIGLGVVAALIGIVAVMPRELHEALTRSLNEVAHQLHMARGP
jgi:hypothetical protein